MGNQVTATSLSSQTSPLRKNKANEIIPIRCKNTGHRRSCNPQINTLISITNESPCKDEPLEVSKSVIDYSSSTLDHRPDSSLRRKIVDLHLSQSASDLSIKSVRSCSGEREESKNINFLRNIRNRLKNRSIIDSKDSGSHGSSKRPPKLRRAETECPTLSRDGLCNRFLTIPSAKSISRLRCNDSENDVSYSSRFQKRCHNNVVISESDRSSILDECISGTDLNSESSSRLSFDRSRDSWRQQSVDSNESHLQHPLKRSPCQNPNRKWATGTKNRRGLSLEDPSFESNRSSSSLAYVNKSFIPYLETESIRPNYCFHLPQESCQDQKSKGSNLDCINEIGQSKCTQKSKKTVSIDSTQESKVREKFFFDKKNLSKSISCYALKLLPSNASYHKSSHYKKHTQEDDQLSRQKFHRLSQIISSEQSSNIETSEDLSTKMKLKCAIQQEALKSTPALIQTNTSELLKYLANFVAFRCSHLIGPPLDPNLKHLQKNQDVLGLQPIAVISWIRSIDRNLIVNGWSEIAFLNPSTVTFLYMLLKDYLIETVSSEYELHSIIMTCLYLSYSYLGNEISYPLRPFIIAEMANKVRKHHKFYNKSKRSLSASISNMSNPILSNASSWKSSFHYGDDVEGSNNNINASSNISSLTSNINLERDLFFDRCLKIMNEKSSDMLRINAEPALFAELLTELMTYTEYQRPVSPALVQRRLSTSPIIIENIDLTEMSKTRIIQSDQTQLFHKCKSSVQNDANNGSLLQSIIFKHHQGSC